MPEQTEIDALGQVIEALVELVRTDPVLATETFFADRSAEDAIQHEELPCWVVFPEAYQFQPDIEQGQTRHTAIINFDRLDTSANVGITSRANRVGIARVIAALQTDRTLGGRLEDAQETDIASPMENGRSIGGASLQIVVTFHTPRGDHFTILQH